MGGYLATNMYLAVHCRETSITLKHPTQPDYDSLLITLEHWHF
jgi:hypothetical protein